jgi:1-acyl-sn-glycerol-3-phosphate acyltransferase
VGSARIRFACLWLSLLARGLADWGLRLLVQLSAAGPLLDQLNWSGHLATALFIAPFLVLAPLNGCLSNSLPRRLVLSSAAAVALVVVVLFALGQGPWQACLALTAIASAVYSPARFAMLPAAAADTHLPLPRLNGWAEVGNAAGIVGGIALAWAVVGPAWPGGNLTLTVPGVQLILALNAFCLVTALPVCFPSDVRRPEPPLQAVAGFFGDTRRILRIGRARGFLLGLAALQAVLTAATMAVIAQAVPVEASGKAGQLLWAIGVLAVGAMLGCAAASLQGNPVRSPGLIPLGLTGLTAIMAWTAFRFNPAEEVPQLLCLLLGFLGGLTNTPLRSAYLAAVPADARGNGMAVMNALIYLLTTILALVMIGAVRLDLLASASAQLFFLTVLAGAGTVLAWLWLFPQVVLLATEACLWPQYRIRVHGPGQDHLPLQGPLLVLANHSSYLDPFWIGKVMPCHLRPLMTSAFYDLPFIRWMMIHVVRAIRVDAGPKTGLRMSAGKPANLTERVAELREAVVALRRGECLLVFPEAQLRRKEDQLLRRFGQGVWHILRELPQTPVLVCWIEGGWGSWASYAGGPPIKNKPLDIRRRIEIAFAEPATLPPEVLANHRTTRTYLMRACLECRRSLGLEVPAISADSAGEEDSANRAGGKDTDPDAHQINS